MTMSKGVAVFSIAVAIVAGMVAALSLRQTRDQDAVIRENRAALSDLANRLEALEAEVKSRAESRARDDAAATTSDRPSPPAAVAVDSAAGGSPKAPAAAKATQSAGGAEGRPAREVAREEFIELLNKIMGQEGGSATADEQQRFWEAARTTNLLAGIIGDLEKEVEADPDAIDARMDLSRSYVVKVMSVPDGPERGAWALKAEAQWQEVLNREPNHWEPQYSLGFSWSQWPDFLNKTTDAIAAFERAREIQEVAEPQSHQSDTYLQLSRLYLKQGNMDKARATLEAGLKRHSDDKKLGDALGAMGK
jgi:tetratricopeptide (TPR) repeat protein